MCVLSSNIVDDILNKNNVSHHGFENMHVTNEMKKIHFYFTCVLIHNLSWIKIFLSWEIWKKDYQKKKHFMNL
jgi:hypothetical protein